jgi:gas vesicle protein
MTTTFNDVMGTAKNTYGSARNGAEHAVDAAMHAVGSAKDKSAEAVSTVRSTFLDKINAMSSVLAALGSLRANDALGWVGLSRRQGPLASIGLFSAGFAAGAAMGAGAGLLLAPTSGAELRKNIKRSIATFGRDSEKAIHDVEAKVEAKVDDLKTDVLKTEATNVDVPKNGTESKHSHNHHS